MSTPDDHALEAILGQVVSEISNRTSIQYNTSLAALAGLGVIAAQVNNIQNRHIPIFYFAVAIALGLIGLFQLEQDRSIALLGAHRRWFEQLILRDRDDPSAPVEIEGWEDFKRKHNSPGVARAIANSSRYLLTLGSAIAFGAIFWVNAKSSRYDTAKVCLVAASVVLLMLIVDMAIRIQQDSKAGEKP